MQIEQQKLSNWPRVIATLSCIVPFVVGGVLSAQPLGEWRTNDEPDRYGGGGGGANLPISDGTTPSRGPITPVTPSNQGRGTTTPIEARAPRARFTERAATLPQERGQVWRDYDIRPYTLKQPPEKQPEQILVDWILRETGYEAWHTQPIGILSAGRETLSVYHTPEMHSIVDAIVTRFVNRQTDAAAFTLRIMTVKNPNWRAKAMPLVTPIPVQSPGVQGWLLAKEDAALLQAELRRRSDFRELNSAQQLITNGEQSVISTMRPKTYMKGIVRDGTTWPGYQPEMGQLEEGFTLEFSPLLSTDMTSADAVLKLRLLQVEKMLPVQLELPTSVAPNQRVKVEVPQITTANLHERFRWPVDKVLLLSMGVVAAPGPARGNPLTNAVPLFQSPPRADALLMVECRGNLMPAGATASRSNQSGNRAANLPQQSFQGRY